MNLDRILQHALSLQSIPAPTFHEEERAAYLEGALSSIPSAVLSRDDTGNLYCKLSGGEEPPLVLTSHLDSVFPLGTPLESRVGKRRIHGPGIGDNALGLAVLIELAHDFQDYDLQGDLWLVANVGEEGLGNLLGMYAVTDRLEDKARGFIVVEGMALGHIYHRALPVRRYRVTAESEGGHAWIHTDRASAIHLLIQFGERILREELPKEPKTTMNIGSFQGGSGINTVASRAYFEMEIRSESAKELERLAKRVTRLAEGKGVWKGSLRIQTVGQRPAGGISKNHPLVQAAVRSQREAGIDQVKLDIGSTDASVPLSRGIPAVCVGITRGGNAHSLEEYIEVDPIPIGYQALKALILQSFAVLHA